MAKLWLVERTDDPFYEVFSDFVAIAETKADALAIDPNIAVYGEPSHMTGTDTSLHRWPAREHRKATCIGEADPNFVPEYPPVVCYYFLHG